MAVLASIPPLDLKAVFEAEGFTVGCEDIYNWLMVRGDEEPFLIPKRGRLVGVDIMAKAMARARGSASMVQTLHGAVKKHIQSSTD